MRHRASASIVVLALLVLGEPASAQDPFTSVAFGDVAFAFGPELGASVNVTRVPGQAIEEQSPFPPDAPHITFTFYGPSPEFGRTPRVGFTSGTVRAYRIADLEGFDVSTGQVEALRDLLEDRPDLDAYTTVSADSGERLPHLPVDTGAAQALRARATYIDGSELTGIAYLVGYRQDVFPFAAGDFFYTFQAISTDGEWYVSGDFILEASMFPQRVRQRDAQGFPRRWPSYLEESTQTLNAAAPDAFEPSLTAIDILISSFTFQPPSEG